MNPTNPSGKCQCGCGGITPIAKRTRPDIGHVAGQHVRFMVSHFAKETPEESVERFMRNTRPTPNGCLEWTLRTDRKGYGHVRWFGRMVPAHHVALILDGREPPTGRLVTDHLCRNRRCVNPEHLEVVDTAINARRGNNTKLTPEQVDEIRAAMGSNAEIGRRYGVHRNHVSKVRAGTAWRPIREEAS